MKLSYLSVSQEYFQTFDAGTRKLFTKCVV